MSHHIMRILRRKARNYIQHWPAMYLSIFKMKRPSFVVDRETEIVVEGFPRSGNSFLEAYLYWSFGRSLRVAHHTHAWAHVHKAITLHKPCLVLVREPDDCVRSLLLKAPELFTAKAAYDEYSEFYENILSLVTKYIVLVPFNVATTAPEMAVNAMMKLGIWDINPKIPGEMDKLSVLRIVDELTEIRTGNTTTSYSPHRPTSSSQEIQLERNLRYWDLQKHAVATGPSRARAKVIYQMALDRVSEHRLFDASMPYPNTHSDMALIRNKSKKMHDLEHS